MRNRNRRLAFLSAVAVLVGLVTGAGLAYGQTVYGSLAGTVYDASGAIIPKANVVIRNLDTGLTRETTADNTGFWRVPALQPARYAVEVAAPSFGKLVRAPIVVEPTVERTVDVTLSPGAVTEVISVTAEAPLIEQTKAQLSHAVSGADILSLPGQNTMTGLALLLPGSAPNAQSRPGSGFTINGGRTRSNNFMIDGANNNDQSLSTPRQQFTPEVLAEVRIITNNFSAEFGRNAGSIVQQTTRSGTNELHGIVRWSWLGNGYDSLTTAQQRTFAAQKALGLSDYLALRKSRGVTVQNQAVFSAGGPIKKDSTFFFSSYDFDLRRSTASPVAATISSAGYALLDQYKSSFAPGTVDFLKSIYPVANDPTSRGSLSVPVPAGPTISIPVQQFNRAAQGALPYARNIHRGLMKVDSKLTRKDNLSVRYAIDDDMDPGTPNALAVNQLGAAGRNQNGTINHVRVVSPSLISEARAVYGRRSFKYTENFPPQFSISGSGLPTIGNQNYPQFRTDNLYEFTNNWSWIRSRHSVRFGANFLRYQLNSFFAPSFMGVISYPSMTDFLNDRNAQFSQYAGTGLTPARTSEFGGFFGDDWRVASSLTLNLGIRYEYVGAPFGYFSEAKPDVNNFAPRFGFAWSPKKSDGWLRAITGDGKLAIRGGYAISYDQVFQNILLNNARNFPRGVSITLDAQTGKRMWDAASRPKPPTPQDYVAQGKDPKLLPLRLFSPNKRISQPYGQQFSFGFERQLYTSYALRVFYVGSHGVKLVREVEQNIGFQAVAVNANPSVYAGILPGLQPVKNAAGTITQYQRDPTSGSILVGDGYASSIYHSLQVTFAKQYRDSFGYSVNYTWSAYINDSDDILGGQANRTLPSVPFNLKLDRARSGFDVPHRLVASYTYDFPNFQDGAGVLGRVLGGWSLSGANTFANGTPYTILNGNNALGILPGQIATINLSQRANYNPSGDPRTGSSPTITNPRFIANPTNSGIIGNLGANTERLGRIVSVDAAVVKKIKTWVERGHYIELRWEIYNALNHRNFDQVPTNTVSASTNLGLFMNLGQTNVSGRTFLWNIRYIF